MHERAWTRIEAALNLAQAENEQHVLFAGILNSFRFINVSNHNDTCASDAYIFSVVGTATVNCSACCLLINIRSCTKVQCQTVSLNFSVAASQASQYVSP